MKTEPDVFGIEHLKARPRKTASWDGVRNYQARNFMRTMKRGDLVLFYHSSCPEPGVAAIAKVVKQAYPDHSAWDPTSEYYDPKSTPQKPLWYMVDVKLERELKRPIPLEVIKAQPALKHMRLVQRGNRLSVMPVTAQEWKVILKLEQEKTR